MTRIAERYVRWYRKTAGTRTEIIELVLWMVFIMAAIFYCWQTKPEDRV